MKILWASDHAGITLRPELIKAWKDLYKGDEHIDLGPFGDQSVDYSDFSLDLCRQFIRLQRVEESKSEEKKREVVRGVLICGSGIGVSMSANRFSGVRAALCRTEEDVKLSREHNNANVLCLGARITLLPLAKKMIAIFRDTPFAGGRHQVRIAKFSQLGERD